MNRNYVQCGCERGGDCTKTTMCAMDSALQDQAENYERYTEKLEAKIRFEIQSFQDGYAPDPVPHDLGVFIKAIEVVLND